MCKLEEREVIVFESNDVMVEYFKSLGLSEKVAEAFREVDRKFFIPADWPANLIYADAPVRIGHGQTISQPSMVAMMLEALNLEPWHKVLDIGTGSGWLTRLMAKIVAEKAEGRVVTVENIRELHEQALINIARCSTLPSERLIAVLADGMGGYPPEAPYDRIIISAYLPDKKSLRPFFGQLKVEGVIVVPMYHTKERQKLWVFIKSDEKNLDGKPIVDCLFVPINTGVR